MITTLTEFRGYDQMSGQKIPGRDPYNASLYLPFYQGEYDKNGKLKDPTDPMLFWLVPIVQYQHPDWESREEYKKRGFDYYFRDYVSRHAGCPRPVE
jgi:hypothetical protein